MKTFTHNMIRHFSGKHIAVLQILQAWFAAFALCNIGGLSSASVLSVLFFGAMLLLFSYGRKLTAAAQLPAHFSSVTRMLAGLFMLFYMASEHKGLTGGFDNRMFRFSYVAATAAGLFCLFLVCCRILMILFAAIRPRQYAKALSVRKKAAVFAVLLLCWLPWFLYNYPGVMTPDSISQFSQATGIIPYSSHHSLIHTLLFQLFYQIGFGLTRDPNAGIAFYIIFQMLTLAAVETAVISLLAKKGLPRLLLYAWILFWGLVPYNAIYAVTMWKDVLFSAFMLLYALVLYQLLTLPQWNRKEIWKLLLLLFISGWFTCMLRSNGLYVFVFLLPFTLFVFRRHMKIMLPLQAAILLLALFIKGPVPDYFGVTKPHFTESLSIPLQQVARVVDEGRSLTEEQRTLIEQVVDPDLIPSYYNPVISDPVKALVIYNNADYLSEHKADFFRLWMQLGLTYPRDYIEAFIDQTKGYWYPAPADMRTYEGISPNEVGLAWPHLLRGQIPVKISEILLKLPDLFPVYGILWSIGAFTWLMLFLMAFQFLYGGRRFLLVFLPFLATILTLLLATPVASDMRYAYPLLLGMPLLISTAVQTSRTVSEKKVSAVVFHAKKG
ncbi:MAG: DUF6020 family protein [Eubacteriales bacterium]|nr:DUF6020 family protein [Eubacteriales bacterium]